MANPLPLYNAPSSIGTGAESSGANSCTPGLHAGWAEGDWCAMLVNVGTTTGVATVTSGGTETWELVSGFPLTLTSVSAGAGIPHRMYLFVSRLTAGAATPTVTRSVAGDYIWAQITALRGAYSLGNAVDAINASISAIQGDSFINTLTFLDAAPTLVNCAYMMFATTGDDAATLSHGAITNASVTGLAEKIDGGTATGTGGTGYAAVGVEYYKGAFAAGAPTCNPATGSRQYIRFAMAVKPPQLTPEPDIIPSAEVVYAPSLNSNLFTLSMSRIESSEVVYAPALYLDFSTMRPARIESSEAVYGGTLVLDLFTIKPARIESAEIVYGFGIDISDTIEPVISNMTPADGTPIRELTSIEFDVTDDTGLVACLLFLTWTDPVTNTEEAELIYDGEAFRGKYTNTATNVVTTISGGLHFKIRRAGGWPQDPDGVNLPISLEPVAVDGGGNIGVAA